MSQEKQALMEGLYNETFHDIKEGEIVKGRVISVNNKEAVVDIGFKSEGFVPIEEFRNEEKLEAGAEIDVLIESIEDDEGRLVLSHMKAEKLRGWMKMGDVIREGDIVDGRIVKQVKGGFIVDVDGVEAFLPMSLSAFKGVSSQEIMTQKYKFQIAKLNKARRNLILSRREVVQKERELVRDRLWNELVKGQRRSGMVKGITDFGAFIDLGGVDGLLHITDMSWSKISHPSEVVAVGDKIEVMILNLDRKEGKVSLGLKQKQPDPWSQVETKYSIGSKVKGKVVNILAYGVFVELEKGIEGLIHISEISWAKRVANLQGIFAVGYVIDVQILRLDRAGRRISLSVKQLEANPWLDAERKFTAGSRVEDKVRGFTDYGAFVELDNNLEGMIHVSDMSWTKRVNHPQDVLKKGQKIEILVLAVDGTNRRISLGLRQTEANPWPEIARKYPIDTVLEAEVVQQSPFGVFAKIDENLEGLIYSSEIDKETAEKLKPSDKINDKVIKVDVEQGKIGLSARV